MGEKYITVSTERKKKNQLVNSKDLCVSYCLYHIYTTDLRNAVIFYQNSVQA